jgi:hypothetical protein
MSNSKAMDIKKRALLFLIILASWGGAEIKAQQRSVYNYPIPGWEFGAQLGFGQYYGDISQRSYFQKFSGETRFSGQLFARRHFNERFGLGFSLHRSGLRSIKDNFSDGAVANLEYSGRIFEIGVHGYLNLSNLFWGYQARRLNLYATLGLHYGDWKGTLTDSQTQNVIFEEGLNIAGLKFNSGGMVIPVTLGLKYAISNNLSLDFNGSIHTVLSDDLDYYADGFKQDILLFTHVGIAYHFGDGRKTARPANIGKESTGPVEVIDYDRFEIKKEAKVVPAVLPLIEMEPVSQTKTFEFRVQVLAKREKITHISQIFPNITFEYPIVVNNYQGIHRYSTGSFSSFNDAQAYANTMRNRGIHDAFVVAYRNDVRIPITAEMKD